MLDNLAQRLTLLKDRAIIAIDDVDGAVKTTFANLVLDESATYDPAEHG